jgi:hypothetical protein
VKPSMTISRGARLALAASILLYAAVWLTVHRLRPIQWAGDPELTALVAEQERLRDFGDATCAALRLQSDEVLRHAWTKEDLRTLREKLGSGWGWESRDAGDWERHIVITRSPPRFDEWPACVALVRELENQPGLTVESLDIAAEGAGHRRRFSRFSIGLRFIMADATTGKAERPAPSRGPLPLASGEQPAATPKVGPVPSLRPPSAGPKPPASGPASAAVRADPPGPRAGVGQPVPIPKPPNQQNP